jgi:hydroxymethylpyrimidine pyrophosphatase-like HAD family hydrolase
MDYLALASDGDGTLTRGGHLGEETRRALERLRDAGYTLVLTTGESSKDLAGFPHLELFDRVVAENGAALYRPDSGAERLLSKPAPPELTRALRKAGVHPLKVGRVIVATICSQERKVRAALGGLVLDWQVVRNCKDLMVVPPGVNKATGLAAALRELRLPPARVVGVGNAENDADLLEFCGLGVAVANAAPELKGRADLVTRHGVGRGVVELIERLLAGELRPPSRTRKSG